MTRRWLVAIVTTALVATAAPAQAADHAATQAVLDRYLAQAGPGAAVHSGAGWTLHTGTAEIHQQRAITARDHFRIGSQTKTFTAAVVLQLVDEGRVRLDAPIERYLPGVVTGTYDGEVITVRQLLQHTSGLIRDVRDARANPGGGYDLAELVRSVMDEPPAFAPGAKQEYSNVGYLVLGLLIERLTGQTARDAITSRVITPLGLTGTTFPPLGSRALRDPFLPGYLGGRIGSFFFWTEATTSQELTFWSTAGAMESTLDDIAKFYRALLDGRVVSAAALDEMRTTLNGYGLALFRMPLSCGGEAWGHNGLLPTGHFSMTMAADNGKVAALVTNNNSAGPLAQQVLDSALCE